MERTIHNIVRQRIARPPKVPPNLGTRTFPAEPVRSPDVDCHAPRPPVAPRLRATDEQVVLDTHGGVGATGDEHFDGITRLEVDRHQTGA